MSSVEFDLHALGVEGTGRRLGIIYGVTEDNPSDLFAERHDGG